MRCIKEESSAVCPRCNNVLVGIYREEIEKNYLEILFDTISRSIQTKAFVMPQSFLKKNQKLTRIRMEIYAQTEQICTVDE